MKNSSKFLIVDTETGGFAPEIHSILSLGAIVFSNGEILDSIQIFIAEDEIVAEKEALDVNGISLGNLHLSGLKPIEAVKKFEEFLAPHFNGSERIELVGQNIGFDVGFMRRLYRLAKRNFELRFSHRSIDTSSIMHFLMLRGELALSKPSLDEGLKYFEIQITPEERHSALGDAIATSKLFAALLSKKI